MPRSATTDRHGAAGTPSRQEKVQAELLQAMQEAVIHRANRAGLTIPVLRRRIRKHGLRPACFFLTGNPTLKSIVKYAEAIGCRPIIRFVKDDRR